MAELSDKQFWEGIKYGVKRGWFRREGMELVVLADASGSLPLAPDEHLVAVLAKG